MKRTGTLFIYIGAAGLLFNAIGRFYHQHFTVLAVFGCVYFLAGIVLYLVAIYPTWKKGTPGQKLFAAAFWLGLALIPTSVLMKYLNLSDYNNVAIAGCLLLLVYVLYYLYAAAIAPLRTTPIGKPAQEEVLAAQGITPSDIEQYTGTYTNTKLPLQITITQLNGAPVARATKQSAFYLEVMEKGVFKYWKRDIVLEFNTEKNELILRQHGGYFPFTKETPSSAN